MIIPKNNLMQVATDTTTHDEYFDLAFETAEPAIESALTNALIDAKVSGNLYVKIDYTTLPNRQKDALLADIEDYIKAGYAQVLRDRGFLEHRIDRKVSHWFTTASMHEAVLRRLATMLESVGYSVQFRNNVAVTADVLTLIIDIEE